MKRSLRKLLEKLLITVAKTTLTSLAALPRLPPDLERERSRSLLKSKIKKLINKKRTKTCCNQLSSQEQRVKSIDFSLPFSVLYTYKYKNNQKLTFCHDLCFYLSSGLCHDESDPWEHRRLIIVNKGVLRGSADEVW